MKKKSISTMYKRAVAVVTALIFILFPCGCRKDKTVAGSDSDKPAAAQTYPVGSYERMAADRAASGEDISCGDVIDFGGKSIFKGIKVESDENGELVCTDNDGAIWYKIADKRFGSYSALKKFVIKKSGARTLDKLAPYFREKDGKLYFVNGANGREVKDRNLYYLDDSAKLTVSVTHTRECEKRYGISQSRINFVREKSGKEDKSVWKLDSVVIYKGQS